jgi:hypothetical protein
VGWSAFATSGTELRSILKCHRLYLSRRCNDSRGSVTGEALLVNKLPIPWRMLKVARMDPAKCPPETSPRVPWLSVTDVLEKLDLDPSQLPKANGGK